MNNILNISEPIIRDDSISKVEFITYNSFHDDFRNGSSLKFQINNTQAVLFPSEGYLSIEGK